MRVLILEDEQIMADCIELAVSQVDPRIKIIKCTDAVMAMQALDELPDLIFLDILLTGPDGFTFLNELTSYADTAEIPVVIISSLDLAGLNLDHYGVKRVLKKEEFMPQDVQKLVKEFYV